MTISEFQRLIAGIYLDRDRRRGLADAFMWLCEETGELARALRRCDPSELREEFADVLAWLATLANIAGVDLEAAARQAYESGCPKCGGTPCRCPSDSSGGEQCHARE